MLLTGTVPALKNRFLGHFSVTNSQTHKPQTDGRKVGLTELHVAAKYLKKSSKVSFLVSYYVLIKKG